ncbi:hypothetical protein [Phormidium sp. FACHB-1136]|uniref:hypothetical protein n=1 Tax=Phormidium sp. FACHB-1136 TaxID=2692848 RepID=UPI00168226E6|nr:hypothetical protein [Phormidium sp. FACHB-1136]MBD2429441.1 hypothetical protein [Phormidium sp. FACHB-1136]
MKIFPANNKKWLIHFWAGKYPNRLAHLWSPGSPITVYPHLPYALDNGAFAAFCAQTPWHADRFKHHVQTAAQCPKPPEWLVVPDRPLDAAATLTLWHQWEPWLRRLNIPLAFAAQDGHRPEDVPDSTDWIFLGGSDRWKFAALPDFVATGKPVHVGRINGRSLWQCERLGAASCDGTGWFRGDPRQLAILEHYLRCSAGEAEPPEGGQLSVLQAQTITESFVQRLEAKTFPATRLDAAIPKGIERSHLILAAHYWWPTPAKHQPRKWVVEVNGQHFPPKLLISRANIWANGYPWPTRLFSGGEVCHRFLESRGFQIVPVSTPRLQPTPVCPSRR